MKLPSPLRGWLDLSLRNRAIFTMVGIAMGATTLLAAASFLVSHQLIAENTLQTQRAALAAFERQLDFESRELIGMLQAMSRNAFISNALVDSLGRDQYLVPFLRDQNLPGGWTGSLWLVDFKGRPIASNVAKTDFPYMHSAALQSALSSGEQKVETYQGAAQLMIAAPVVFPPTKSVEGAVVAVIDFASALDHNSLVLAGGNCFRLVIGGAGIRVPDACALNGDEPVLSEHVTLAGALAQLNPSLELYVPQRAGFTTVGVYLLAYLTVIGAVFIAVLWASRRMAARIIDPLAQVTETANRIVRDDRLDLRVTSESADEVGQLATSFNHMVEGLQAAQARMRTDMERIRRAESKLQALNAELEQRVIERTSDLEVTIVDLNRAREDAEQANQAKSEFLSRMSHELRTPLNAILGFAQMLRLRGSTLADGERTQFVGQIEKAGWHLLELIKELLDLSRIEAGTMVISREPVPLRRLCAECIELLKPLASVAGVTVSDRTVEAEPLFALGDRTRMNQVLMNLLSNAVKYNRRGGSVTLTLRAADGDWVEIGVADTGRGFTAEQLRELYQPFNRLGADRRATEGTGIGLVISKRLTEMMGGSLKLASQEGAGALFTLRLPRAHPVSETPTSEIPPATLAAENHAETARIVLYIEDNPSNVELVESALSLRPNVNVIAAPDGPTGLALVAKKQPDMVLIDISLPGIDGYEVCRRLRARAEFKATPILAISANAMPADIEQGKACGFDDYLTKPLDVRALLAHLDRLLDAAVARRQ